MKITRNIIDVFPDEKPHEVHILSGKKDVGVVFKKGMLSNEEDDRFTKAVKEDVPNLAWHINFRGKEFGVMIFADNDVDLGASSKKVEALIEVLLINAGQSIKRLREKAA